MVVGYLNASFIVSRSTVGSSYRRSASDGTFRDSYRAQGQDKRDILYCIQLGAEEDYEDFSQDS